MTTDPDEKLKAEAALLASCATAAEIEAARHGFEADKALMEKYRAAGGDAGMHTGSSWSYLRLMALERSGFEPQLGGQSEDNAPGLARLWEQKRAEGPPSALYVAGVFNGLGGTIARWTGYAWQVVRMEHAANEAARQFEILTDQEPADDLRMELPPERD